MHIFKSITWATVVLLSVVACSDAGPELEIKRLVAVCVQEPAVMLQEYYGRPRIVSTVSEKAPIEQILELARRNRESSETQARPMKTVRMG